jgi:alkanesulfonate monooxygenase SsuD/methylene tetrahydromethanopterin reductase-like flavin-dependent oxidoreductase (luciferase family)
VHLHGDADRAWEEAAPGIAYLEGAIADYGAGGAPAPRPAPGLRRDAFLVGTPDEVADRLRELHRACGFDHYAFWARLPGLTLEQSLASMRLFASEVAPRVRAH